MDRDLSKVYFNTAHRVGYTGAANLIKEFKGKYKARDIQQWLSAQDAFTLHRPVRKKFTRNSYRVSNINDLFQADLNDLRSIAKYNDNYKYILTVIDVFSRYAFAVPLYDKRPSTIISAFEKIFNERKPIYLQTDKGSEFIAKSVRDYLTKNDIKYYVAHNPDVKSALCERLNRSLKERMFRYFTKNNTRRYIDVLQNIVSAYNSTRHRIIKMAPKDVNEENVLQVWKNQYSKNNNGVNSKIKFNVDDLVRISRHKNVFAKGYEAGWSDEIFKINKIINRQPEPVYRLKDLKDEDIEGTFYTFELQKIDAEPNSDEYKIDKILDTRGSGRSLEYLVSWVGWPAKFNSWISAKNIRYIDNA